MMDESILVTIGVPVYNVEPYVEKCLLSALNQTYQNLEIIVVDDCGTDASMDVVRRLQETHPRGKALKIYRQPYNRGPGEARNVAIDHAKGKYLYFLDSDDYMALNAIERMLLEAEKHHTDVTIASMQAINDKSQTKVAYTAADGYAYQVISGKDAFAQFVCTDLRWHINIASWNMLFNVDFLRRNHLRFAVRKDEDALFLSDFYSEVESAVLMPDVFYYYVIREGSIMGRQKRDIIPVTEIRERFFADRLMTARCERLKGRTFYDAHCARVMKHKFRAVCAALRHRHRFDDWLSDRELHVQLKHPMTLTEILKAKRYRAYHLLFYLMSRLPSWLGVRVAYLMGSALHWI